MSTIVAGLFGERPRVKGPGRLHGDGSSGAGSVSVAIRITRGRFVADSRSVGGLRQRVPRSTPCRRPFPGGAQRPPGTAR